MGNDTAILLLNMGGPVRLDAIQPFLLTLFQDRDIIQLGPAWLQPLLAQLIVRLRLPKVRAHYQAIGGGSPLLVESARQALALNQALCQAGKSEKAYLCFRYAPPRAQGILRYLKQQGVQQVLPVSLYPHYCTATTGSSLRELTQEADRQQIRVLPGVEDYPDHPLYIQALADTLRPLLDRTPHATLLFSAHSLPQKRVDQGDPYVGHIQRTLNALLPTLGPLRGGYQLAYQSKVGPVKWLSPSLDDVLQACTGKEVIVCPVSFVSEHIETLHELDQQYREKARHYGVKSYHRAPALGTQPAYMACLRQLVCEQLAQHPQS